MVLADRRAGREEASLLSVLPALLLSCWAERQLYPVVGDQPAGSGPVPANGQPGTPKPLPLFPSIHPSGTGLGVSQDPGNGTIPAQP